MTDRETKVDLPEELPEGLPVLEDDGAADHLPGKRLPSVALESTAGNVVDLSPLPGVTVAYCFPLMGRPDSEMPQGWDEIPGARGCTPQSCAFRDHHAELRALGALVYGISAQDVAFQMKIAERLHLPFELLSDEDLILAEALSLPTFEVEGLRLLRRLTLIVTDGRVQKGGMVMNPWIDLEPWRERNKDLLREAEQRRLARELRQARRAKRIEVRWSLPGDEHKIADLLELNGRPRWEAFEERFIVAEQKGKTLSVLPYQTMSKRLWVGLLVTDPWVEERPVARALYAGVGKLAREMGVREVLAQSLSYADYPYEAGYLRCGPWWWLDTSRPADRKLAAVGGWRRMVALLCRVFRP